eukprot:6868949-Prymnesium_polylepis.6
MCGVSNIAVTGNGAVGPVTPATSNRCARRPLKGAMKREKQSRMVSPLDCLRSAFPAASQGYTDPRTGGSGSCMKLWLRIAVAVSPAPLVAYSEEVDFEHRLSGCPSHFCQDLHDPTLSIDHRPVPKRHRRAIRVSRVSKCEKWRPNSTSLDAQPHMRWRPVKTDGAEGAAKAGRGAVETINRKDNRQS